MTTSLTNRKPITFNDGFVVERRYLTALLEFANNSESASMSTIQQATKIPQGQSTGKLKPHIQYAEAMGLITTDGPASAVRLSLTGFGQTVLAEDPYFSHTLTQWLSHLNLCRANGGADLWYQTFSAAPAVIGLQFSEDTLRKFLETRFTGDLSRYMNPLLNNYVHDSSFSLAKPYESVGKELSLAKAPLLRENVPGYAALFLTDWELQCPDREQLTLEECLTDLGFLTQTQWRHSDMQLAMEYFAEIGVVKLDGKLGSVVLTKLRDSSTLLPTIYDDLA